MKKEKYYNLRTGHIIELLQDVVSDGITFKKGTLLEIITFPYKVRLSDQEDGYVNHYGQWTVYQRFIHAKDKDGRFCRPFMTQVFKSQKKSL